MQHMQCKVQFLPSWQHAQHAAVVKSHIVLRTWTGFFHAREQLQTNQWISVTCYQDVGHGTLNWSFQYCYKHRGSIAKLTAEIAPRQCLEVIRWCLSQHWFVVSYGSTELLALITYFTGYCIHQCFLQWWDEHSTASKWIAIAFCQIHGCPLH